MAVRSRFQPEESALRTAPIVLHLEDSTSATDEDRERVALFFSDPIAALKREFPDLGVDLDDGWTVQTHVTDHHLFPFGQIWTMTAVVVPEKKQVVVTAIKHRPEDEGE